MRVLSLLLALVSAEVAKTPCNLPSTIATLDSLNVCRTEVKTGWSAYDADSGAGEISLTIDELEAYQDIDRDQHHGTNGKLVPKANKRYILQCAQEANEKTVKFTVHRDSALTDFGGEWVKLVKKDSFVNVTNEYEPYKFNKYGAKIPLLRASSDAAGLAGPIDTVEDNVTVYMEVSATGDYEVLYGNKNIYTSYTYTDRFIPGTTDAVVEKRWVAVQFKSTLLRVGSPWVATGCADDAAVPVYDIGTIVPAFFGHPNLNLQKYIDLAADTATATVPTMVVLEIFKKGTTQYTASETDAVSTEWKTKNNKGAYSTCYEAGNACPEDHSVCKAMYCELDRWEEIVRLFQENTNVKVLGAVGKETTSSQYDVLQDGSKVKGFFFLRDGELETDVDSAKYTTVYALGEPLLAGVDEDATPLSLTTVDTYVTLSGENKGLWNPYSWYPTVDSKKWAAILDEITAANMPGMVDILFDRGYGYVFMTDKTDYKTSSEYNRDLFKAIADKKVSGTVRRLQERQLETAEYSWGCDDTLYHCSPVCLGQDGPVTTIADDALCADAPVDPCKCQCYYDVEWDCADGKVVCKATKGVETMIVGDLLCTNRGTPKPTFESLVNTRQAGECVPLKTTRGEYPIAECLAHWATEAPEPEVEEDEEVEETTPEATAAPVAPLDITITESFSPVAAFALAALLQ